MALLRRLRGLALLLACAPIAVHAQEALPALMAQWEHARVLNADGKAEEALPYLIALNAQLPDVPRLQLELGLAYLQLGQDSAAKRALKAAQSSATASASERTVATHALQALKDRSPWSTSLRGALVPQSNANGKSEQREIVLDGFTFVFDEVAESGVGLRFDLTTTYHDKRAQTPSPYSFSASLAGEIYENAQWNDYSLGFEQAYSKPGQTVTLTFATLQSLNWISDSLATLEAGLSLRLLTQIDAAGRQTHARLEALSRKGMDSTQDDERVLRGALVSSVPVGQNGRLQGSVMIAKTRGASAAQSGLAPSFGLSYAHDLHDWGQASVSAQRTRDLRDGVSSISAERRKDDILNLSLSYTPFLDLPWSLKPTFSIALEDRHSTIGLYEWSNLSGGVSFSRDF